MYLAVICVLQITPYVYLFSVCSSLVLTTLYTQLPTAFMKKQCEDTPYFMIQHDIHMHVDIVIIHVIQYKSYALKISTVFLSNIGNLKARSNVKNRANLEVQS